MQREGAMGEGVANEVKFNMDGGRVYVRAQCERSVRMDDREVEQKCGVTNIYITYLIYIHFTSFNIHRLLVWTISFAF